ncbi:MAG: hypothetical protein M1819_002414 [Sarea resinae]|nr:MAG: hypothetical protein M1819_002414 [Sarea resinae]
MAPAISGSLRGKSYFSERQTTFTDNSQQLLYDHVQDIASKFPASQQDVNTAAASTFRIPYWDWAKVPPAGQTVLPPSISSTTAQVTRPNGTIQTIRNPLYSYVFHPLNTTDLPEEPFNVWHVTYRWPTSQASNAVSQNSEAASALNSSSSSFRSRLYNLFTNYDMFNNFSNEAWIPDGGQYPKYDSVESIHDQVHGLIGGSGNGNMAIIPYSAFDPIFFLHHAMVDRVWAMWSALWTDTYVDPETQQYGTYTVTAGDTLDVNSPLTPFFYETNGNFWTSADVRNPKTFGYTYPDLVDWNVSNSVYQANVRTIINTLYGPNTTATSGKRTGRGGRARAVKRDQGQDGEEETDGVVVEAASVSEKRCHKQHDEAIESDAAVDVKGAEAAGQPQAQTYNEYIANIRALKHSPSLGGSYFIHFYLSSPSSSPVSSANLTSTSPTNASAPFTAPDHIGTHAVFSGLSSTAISGAAYITGTIPLTPALRTHVASGALASLDPDVVRPFLRSGFDWTVQLHNGTILPSTYAVEGLEISVVTASVSHALAVDEFPVWGDLVALEL